MRNSAGLAQLTWTLGKGNEWEILQKTASSKRAMRRVKRSCWESNDIDRGRTWGGRSPFGFSSDRFASPPLNQVLERPAKWDRELASSYVSTCMCDTSTQVVL